MRPFHVRDVLLDAVRTSAYRVGDTFYTRRRAHELPWRKWSGPCRCAQVVASDQGMLKVVVLRVWPLGDDRPSIVRHYYATGEQFTYFLQTGDASGMRKDSRVKVWDALR